MPCSCDGFPVERTFFGKLYRGSSGGFTGSGRIIPETFPWEKVAEDGERALCRAQSIIYKLATVLEQANIEVPVDLQAAITREIEMLRAHKKSEGEELG